MYLPCFPKNSENLRSSKTSLGIQNFQKIELKIVSIRIIRKKLQNRLNRYFGQRINSRKKERIVTPQKEIDEQITYMIMM